MLVPRRRTDPELLDLPPEEQDRQALQGSLMDIRRVNLRLGGVNSALKDMDYVLGRMEAGMKATLTPGLSPRGGRAVKDCHSEARAEESASSGDGSGKGPKTTFRRRKTGIQPARRLAILDVAAGSADITAAMTNYAENKGYKVLSVAADLNHSALTTGRAWNREPVYRPRISPEISYASADGLRLPFPDKSFDIVHCSLVLHHLSEENVINFLKEMARVSRFAIIIGDLRRNIIPWALIWLLTRLFTANRYTRFDGPLSVLKSFTFAEMRILAEDAGIKNFRARRRHFWRMSIVGFV